MKYDVFISYARKDFDEVNSFVEMLKERIPQLTYWFDITGIESGDEFDEKINAAIDNSSCVLVALSDNSLQSKWVKDEVMYARNTDKKVIPLLLKGASLKGWFLLKFGRIDCIDTTNPLQVNKLVMNLCTWNGKEYMESSNSHSLHQKPKAVSQLPSFTYKKLLYALALVCLIALSYCIVDAYRNTLDTNVGEETMKVLTSSGYKQLSIKEKQDTFDISLNVPFMPGSYRIDLDKITKQKIDIIVQQIKSNESGLVELEVMTAFSPDGHEEKNKQLAMMRADAFAELLRPYLSEITATPNYIQHTWQDVADKLRAEGHASLASTMDIIITESNDRPNYAYYKIRTLPEYIDTIIPVLQDFRYTVCRFKLIKLELSNMSR